mmetsp:Transcript_19685/g.44264  ORF Transcript_19685/g.44264 Transcript_19685/m.44264 type:complete len:291 (-) Transcript_19685:123-995(-)
MARAASSWVRAGVLLVWLWQFAVQRSSVDQQLQTWPVSLCFASNTRCQTPKAQAKGTIVFTRELGVRRWAAEDDDVIDAEYAAPPTPKPLTKQDKTQRRAAKIARKKQNNLLASKPTAIYVVNGTNPAAEERLRQVCSKESLAAVDAEWDGMSNGPLAVVQLAFPQSGTVFVVQVLHANLPREARDFLASDLPVKACWAWKFADRGKFRAANIPVANIVDVQPMAAKKMNRQTVGLARASQSLLRQAMDKDSTLSKWSNARLTKKQVKYAALDAWTHLRLYEKLVEKVID